MPFEVMIPASSIIQKQAVTEIEKCNHFTARFGLILSHLDAVELVETRNLALKSSGRIEFGGGIIEKIIKKFCDSPYISRHNYVETLHDLTETFYFYKNETLDLISDDDLIQFMKSCYDGKCHGSLELLSGRELANMARSLRSGCAAAYAKDLTCDEEDFDVEY